MLKLLKAVGWLLVGIAALFILCIPIVIFDDTKDKSSVILGFVLFIGFFGTPGALLLWRSKDLERRKELAAMMRVYDRFTAAEMAQKIGRTEAATDRLILQLAQEEKLDLVFHRVDRSYMHRGRIKAAARVFDSCRACGARLPHEVALEGEAAVCVYCNTAL